MKGSAEMCRRPAFMRMIGTAKMKPKPFDVILLWKFSRFARSRQDSILYKSMPVRNAGLMWYPSRSSCRMTRLPS